MQPCPVGTHTLSLRRHKKSRGRARAIRGILLGGQCVEITSGGALRPTMHACATVLPGCASELIARAIGRLGLAAASTQCQHQELIFHADVRRKRTDSNGTRSALVRSELGRAHASALR
jgi:hypothetical protein